MFALQQSGEHTGGGQEQLPCSCVLIKDISAGVLVDQSKDGFCNYKAPLPPKLSRCGGGGGIHFILNFGWL